MLGETNAIETRHEYDEVTGQLVSIVSTDSTTGDIQDLEYGFDSLGNLTRRQDNKRNVRELIDSSTGYDALNRIVAVERETYSGGSWGGTATALAVDYEDGQGNSALGNIYAKSGRSYSYASPDTGCSFGYAGPHAVTGVDSQDFCYDANGNEVSGYDFATASARTTSWTAFNKPATITDGTDTISFSYGADRARFKQVNGFTGVVTFYIDGLYEREMAGGVQTDTHYIFAAGEAIAIVKGYEGSPATEETLYLHRDHLGSVVEITDDAGSVVESLSYDAFGKRRDDADWDGDPTGYPVDTPRGYTGHEHLDDIGLVHMNGRAYDPDLGRMLSADPIVQLPTHSQSYNRYSYVINNPLRYTDPSGYCFVAGSGCATSGLGGFSGASGFGASIGLGPATSRWVPVISQILIPAIGPRSHVFGGQPMSTLGGGSNCTIMHCDNPLIFTLHAADPGGGYADLDGGGGFGIGIGHDEFAFYGYWVITSVTYWNAGLYQAAQDYFQHLFEGPAINTVTANPQQGQSFENYVIASPAPVTTPQDGHPGSVPSGSNATNDGLPDISFNRETGDYIYNDPKTGPREVTPFEDQIPGFDWHIDRNIFNTAPDTMPTRKAVGRHGRNTKYAYVDDQGNVWVRDNLLSSGYYHGWSNTTFRGTGPNLGSQATYDSEGALVDSGQHMGTFDYGTPGTVEHYNLDVRTHNADSNYTPNVTTRY